MLRLRTTAGLSAAALVVGIASTCWLSTLTSDWRAPVSSLAAIRHGHASAPHQSVASPRWRAFVRDQAPRPRPPASARRAATPDTQAIAATVEPAVPLLPLATPADHSQSWEALRGHLDGRVVVHIRVDGTGRVLVSSVSESSGDPILDEHALRSVRRWRFALSPDHPDGVSGELPMRFSSPDDHGTDAP